MTQYKGNADPDIDELVPSTPIVINGRMFNPSVCIAEADQAGAPDAPGVHHNCVHDWRCYWGNQKRGA